MDLRRERVVLCVGEREKVAHFRHMLALEHGYARKGMLRGDDVAFKK